MKADIDRLMDEKGLDALWITGPAQHNASMVYFTGVGHLTHADCIKKRGEKPVLFHASMERDEAAHTGLKTINRSRYGYKKLLEEMDGDDVRARATMYQRMLEDLDLLEGKIALYGKVDVSSSWGEFSQLKDLVPDLELVGEGKNSLLLEARASKSEEEVKHIREMGQITTRVVKRVQNLLTGLRVGENEELLKDNGDPLRIADVKSKINLWLAELGAENPKGAIFAIGRDAGVPHSSGTESDLVRLGKTIVFDIFPCQQGGGYFYDFTRTWCLGYAPEEARAVYEDVLYVYQTIISELEVGQHAPALQERTCELFERRGHRTIRQDHQLESGYVHSLGHGLGLDIHERPTFGTGATEKDRLYEGAVTTIEPGLYYPDQDMGCRLENTLWVRPDGTLEVLVDYPLDLVLQMEHWAAE